MWSLGEYLWPIKEIVFVYCVSGEVSKLGEIIFMTLSDFCGGLSHLAPTLNKLRIRPINPFQNFQSHLVSEKRNTEHNKRRKTKNLKVVSVVDDRSHHLWYPQHSSLFHALQFRNTRINAYATFNYEENKIVHPGFNDTANSLFIALVANAVAFIDMHITYWQFIACQADPNLLNVAFAKVDITDELKNVDSMCIDRLG